VATATAVVATAKTKFWETCRASLISQPQPARLAAVARVADALSRNSISGNVQAHSAVAHLAERQPASLLVRDDQQERPLVGRRRLLRHTDAAELLRLSRVPDAAQTCFRGAPRFNAARATHLSCAESEHASAPSASSLAANDPVKAGVCGADG